MVKGDAQQQRAIIVALVFAALGGLALWYWGAPNQELLNPRESDVEDPLSNLPAARAEFQEIAERYIAGIRDGNCAQVIDLTWWMQERLRRNAESATPQPSQVVRDELCASIQRDDPDGFKLSVEGIDDQYVLTPGIEYTIIGADEGAANLAKLPAERVWAEIRYRADESTPRDENDRAIRVLRVGINISADGYVLKAGIRGNLDIDVPSVAK